MAKRTVRFRRLKRARVHTGLRAPAAKRRRLRKRMKFTAESKSVSRAVVKKPIGLFKPVHYCILPYNFSWNGLFIPVNTGTVQWQGHMFHANSAYDPYIPALSTFNSSAAGHAYLSTIYNHYCVYKSTITVVVRQTGNSGSFGSMACLLRRDDDGVVPAGTYPEQYNNDPSTVVKVMQWKTDCSGKVVLKQKFLLSKHLNGKSTDAVSANTGTNPAEKMYFMIGFGWADHQGIGSNSPVFQVDIQVRYWTKYYELKDIQGHNLLIQYN